MNVLDMDKSVDFYTDVLGFEIAVRREDGSGTFFTCGKNHHDLALFLAPPNAPDVTEGGLGLNHMAFQVEDYDTLSEYHHKLDGLGMEMRLVDHNMTKSIYIKDPDGNRIELFCNTFDNAVDGLAEMRRPGRKNKELIFS